MKKLRKKLSVMRLEERVLFDAAAVAAAAEAAQQEQENQDLQQQQQELQEQLAQEAAQQQLQQAAGVDSQTPGTEPDTDTDADNDAPAADDAASAQGGEAAQADSAGSQVADAVESITDVDGVEGSDLSDVLTSGGAADVVGDTLEGLNQDQTDAQEPAAVDSAAVAQNDTDADTDAADTAAAFAPDADETPEAQEHHELAIISGTVQDSKLIIDNLAEGTEVLVLDTGSDALDQINEYLDASAVKYDAIHIVSHGGEGFISLNGQRIDMQALQDDPASWAAIGEHLTTDGDILLYGCNIAAGEDGKAFAAQLASLTGADVAASVTSTGQDGWGLEYMTGSITAPVITVSDYDGSLAAYTAVVLGGDDFPTAATGTKQFRFVSGGQLQTRTRSATTDPWGDWTDVANSGSLQWCIDQPDSTDITSGNTTSIVLFDITKNLSNPVYGKTINLGNDDVDIASGGVHNFTLNNANFSLSTTGSVIGDVGNISVENSSFTVSAKDFSGDIGNVTAQGTSSISISETSPGSSNASRAYGNLTLQNHTTFTFADGKRWATFSNVSMMGGGANVTWNVNSDVTIEGVGSQTLKTDTINSTATFEYKANWATLWGGSYNTLVLSGSRTPTDYAYTYFVADSQLAHSISATQVNDDGIVYSDGHVNLFLDQAIAGAKFGQSWSYYGAPTDSQGLNVYYSQQVSAQNINPGNYHDVYVEGTNVTGFERGVASGDTVHIAGTLTLNEQVRFFNVAGTLYTYRVDDTSNTAWNVTNNWTFKRFYVLDDADQLVDWTIKGNGAESGHSYVTDPGFTVEGTVLNSKEIFFEHLGYQFMNVENRSGGRIHNNIELDHDEDPATGAAGRWVSFVHLDNQKGATLDFSAPFRIEEMRAGNGGWTNYGTLNVMGYNYFGFDADTPLKVTNYTQATMTFSNLNAVYPTFTDYVFDNRASGRADGVQQVSLVNGGTITAGASGRVVFVAFEELSGAQERPVYSVQGTGDSLHLAGAMYFELAHTIDAGIYGSIQVNGGTVNFNTAGQQYHGNVTINGISPKTGRLAETGIANINQRSVFNGSFTGNDYSVINVGTEGTHDGNTSDGSDTNAVRFDQAVINRYYFSTDARDQIAWHNNNLRTLSGSDWQDFNLGTSYIGSATAPWQGSLPDPREAQFSDANGTIFSGAVTTRGVFSVNADSVTFEDTLSIYHDFTIAGNNTEFKGAVTFNQGTLRNTVFTYANEDVTGTVFKDSVTISGGSGYTALFYVNALTEFQGSLTNSNGGIVVSHDGNVFHAITNTGNYAEFYMNSAGNYLDHEVKNQSGATFTLNNVNIFTKFTNSARLIVNQEASTASSRSAFITLTNSGTAYFRGPFDIENEYRNTGTTLQQWGDIDYKGGVNNSGEFLLTNTGDDFFDGRYVFNNTVTNSGTFKVSSALAEFKKGITNTGTFLVSSQLEARYTTITDGYANIFNQFTNRGSGALLTVDSADNLFKGAITNTSGLITIGDVNTISGAITNTGTLQLNASVELTDVTNNGGTINLQGAPQVVISVLSMTGGHIEIDADSALHLHTVSDDSNSSFMVMGRYRYGVYGDHVTPDVSDSTHGLFFESTGKVQTINSNVEYQADTFEEAVWFDPNYTVIETEEATWIIIGDRSDAQYKTLTLDKSNVQADAKYKVVEGGTLTVLYAASDTLFNVSGGSLVFDNDSTALTINHRLNIASGSTTISGRAGINFRYLVTNSGDLTIDETSRNVNFTGNLDNFGTATAGVNVSGTVNNYGVYVVSGNGMTLDGSFHNNADAALLVTGNATISGIDDAAGSTIGVQSGATLTVAQAAVTANFANAGTVRFGSDLEFTGAVTGAGGAFSGVNGTENLEFSGTTSGSGVFDNLAAVRYTGTNETNILTGTYGDLELADAVKIVDNGLVQVDGTFTNGNGVRVTATGELRLKGAAAGAGDVTNAGTFDVDGDITVNNHVDNSGTVNVNGQALLADATNNAGGTINMAGAGSIVMLDDNAGTVALSGNTATAIVGGTNSGVIAASGTGAGVLAGNNTGSIQVTGDDVAVTTNNGGSISVSGTNAELYGDNAGAVAVTGAGSATTTMTDAAGASYTVGSGAVLTLGNNGGTYNADFDISGSVVVDAVADFNGTVGANEGSRIIVTGNAAGIDAAGFLTPANKGILDLYGWSDLTGKTISNNVQVHYGLVDADLAGTSIAAGGILGINADSTLNNKLDNGGTVQVGPDALLVYGAPAGTPIDGRYEVAGVMWMTDDAEFSGDIAVSGVVTGDGDLAFTGSVNNAGIIYSAGETGFSGPTSGTGSVFGDAAYSGAAGNVYGGSYTSLTIHNAANLTDKAWVETMNLNGSLSVADGTTLTLEGPTNGSGVMAGGGTVIYNGNASVQSIYAGRYDNLVIGSGAIGNLDAKGDIFIGGDALDQSANAGIAVSSATVTYDGNSPQQVMAGSYNGLSLVGTGTKLMENGVFSVNSFTATGSRNQLLTVTSASSPARWTLDSADVSIHYVNLRDADSTQRIFLDGTNITGGSITNNWAVFNAGGGIGDSFPWIGNRNFQSLAFYADRLALEPAADPFAFAHRLPGGQRPLAVGGAFQPEPLIGAYDSYDLINFDSDDFGIKLLDEESREVLSDASAAGSSDLVELLEEK
ncbi:MAG: DUF4347 domain-containing protein [Lentisphaeria bacterium]|nr:DUF4347 domain-containing protein [Lentisphaeria bacterium]